MRGLTALILGLIAAITPAQAGSTVERVISGKVSPIEADYGALIFSDSAKAALPDLKAWASAEKSKSGALPCYDGSAQKAVKAGLAMARAAELRAQYKKRRRILLDAMAKIEKRIPAEIDRRAGPDPNALTKRLAAMAGPDQVWRFALFRDRPDLSGLTAAGKKAYRAFVTFRICRVDEANTAEMRKILDKLGWPRISEYGERADELAWLLVQHADRHPEFQRAVLKRLAKLKETGETAPKHYAYLYDRIAVRENKPQRFATQMQCIDGKYDPGPLEAPEHVDKLRERAGLPSLAAYMKNFPESCGDD